MNHFHATAYEDDNGDEREVIITFSVSKARAATLEEPAEESELEFTLIERKEGSVFDWFDIEAECNETIFERWTQECWESLEESE